MYIPSIFVGLIGSLTLGIPSCTGVLKLLKRKVCVEVVGTFGVFENVVEVFNCAVVFIVMVAFLVIEVVLSLEAVVLGELVVVFIKSGMFCVDVGVFMVIAVLGNIVVLVVIELPVLKSVDVLVELVVLVC